MVWDITTPAGSEAASSGDDRIRELKADVQTALRGDDTEGVEAMFPGSDASNPVFRYRGLKGTTAARPASGQYGLYFDTLRNALQRDNGSAWEDIATNIPSGTVMVFYQASAPVGWTKVITQDDKALRVVSGTGGGTGGTSAISTGISHTVNAHTHSISTDGNHTHTTSNQSQALEGGYAGGGSGEAAKTHTHPIASSGSHTHGGGATGSATPGTNTVTLAYIDVLLASKD